MRSAATRVCRPGDACAEGRTRGRPRAVSPASSGLLVDTRRAPQYLLQRQARTGIPQRGLQAPPYESAPLSLYSTVL